MKAEDDYIQNAGQIFVTNEAISTASFVAHTELDCVQDLAFTLCVILQVYDRNSGVMTAFQQSVTTLLSVCHLV